MRKLFLVFLILAVAAGSVFAFDPLSYPPPVSGGDVMVDIGLGYVGLGLSNGKFTIPPLFVQVEYALPVNVPISVGGLLAFYRWGYDYPGINLNVTWTQMVFAGRANWHWGFDVSWLDLYTGAWVGYNYAKASYSRNLTPGFVEPNYSGLNWGTQIGAHFYFSKSVGAIVELGWPYLIKAGIALKF